MATAEDKTLVKGRKVRIAPSSAVFAGLVVVAIGISIGRYSAATDVEDRLDAIFVGLWAPTVAGLHSIFDKMIRKG